MVRAHLRPAADGGFCFWACGCMQRVHPKFSKSTEEHLTCRCVQRVHPGPRRVNAHIGLMLKRQVERAVAEKTGAGSARAEWSARPLPGGKVELTFVVAEEVAELLEAALDATMHENPERDRGQALAKALRMLVAAKRQPRASVPAAAERAVFGPRCCSFVGKGGRVCGETRFLELDHIVPRAQGRHRRSSQSPLALPRPQRLRSGASTRPGPSPSGPAPARSDERIAAIGVCPH